MPSPVECEEGVVVARSYNCHNHTAHHHQSCSYLIELLHCTVEGGVAILFVCIVVARTRLVAHPNAIVFDLGGVLFKDLCNGGM